MPSTSQRRPPQHELTLVIPVHNEQAGIGTVLEELRRCGWAGALGARMEVIIVDDGSRDSTVARAQAIVDTPFEIRVLSSRRNVGKGRSVRRGVAAARGRLIGMVDGDDTFDLETFGALIAAVDSGADVVIGNRRLPGSEFLLRPGVIPYVHLRHYIGQRFNDLVRALTPLASTDTQCGMKLFTAEAARGCFERILVGGFVFDIEVLLAATEAGYRIVDHPVRIHLEETDPMWRVAGMSASVLVDLLRVARNYRAGRYRPGRAGAAAV